MARPLFTVQELIGKVPSSVKVSAGGSTDGFLTLQLTGFPESQIINGFQRAINRASQRIAIELKQALDGALSAGVWSTPSGRADIIDTGELLQSGRVDVTDNGVTISYTAPYAALVHFGGYINPYGNTSARVYLPPRPWVDSVLRGGGPVPQFDVVSYYEQEIRAEFN
jgi:hypothetical protein